MKRAVAYSFLDFTTLAAREAALRAELRLNRRTAPQLYLDVQPVTGAIDAPRLGGAGTAIEHALRMRRFDPAQGGVDLVLGANARDGMPQFVDALDAVQAGFEFLVAEEPAV